MANSSQDIQAHIALTFLNELRTIKSFWNQLERVYKPIELIIYSIGMAGNFLALVTLWRSRKMTTPSFAYHRALVATDFLYCINYFVNLMATRLLSFRCREFVYKYSIGPIITGTLNPILSSTCTYVLHYVTTVIALDRVIALFFPVAYQKWNKPRVSRSVILASVVMSATVHSWSAFIQMDFFEYRLNETDITSLSGKHQVVLGDRCWNDSIVYYSLKRDNFSNATKDALTMKDIYNGAWRISYSIIVTLLTLAVILGLVRRRKRREACRSNVSLVSIASETSVMDNRKRKPSEDSACSRYTDLAKKQTRKNRGCERMLFVLMIAVVLLAFFQVAASETSRIFQFVYPAELNVLELLMDNGESMEEKLWHMRFAMYGHFYARIFASAFTAVERSFVCILYMAMNAHFRRELLVMLQKVFCFGKAFKYCGRKFSMRVSSNQIPTQVTGRSILLERQDSPRFVVTDVEPTSGCQYRNRIASQNTLML